MDAMTAETPVAESDVLTPRASLTAIAAQCDHALTARLAKRYSTREALKSLERRAEALLKEPDSRAWTEAFEKVLATANQVFDTLIGEVGAGHA